ncbi:ABC transporter substrate-binding protein [Corynebacterium glucuronolyticum]|uniref:Carbohydrate ABC transporter substrate-binding protein n=2 Tax=Corynebacterium glucuronolyticum TaxID=39791 RepID=A0A7T4EH76_9CORY|nr:ABC transporter substrate-binding protein [Corynebacterium glucuronolyticum]WKD64416.1 maltose ABC transporter periplasmic protein [Corynebacterium glucuronolyticum DSM 44120]MCT1442290.1 ABC transporter substrate-binding protein [Corynebacterium glucuronolyticum]QQB47262.1 carbohydrate ABC transporter substrate-binding protein [Corynebacterium glucuronolyticum]QQU88921.1 carbohydrate ABC transporter substrate-binding protein [Corynebacterium glucuronolyticum]QRO82583.1 carbohydrate ABC tra
MKKMTRFAAVVTAAAVAAAGLAGCSDSSSSADGPSVYFMNAKPEQDAAYQEIAKKYTEETGVEVKVVTAASGTYEQTMKAEVGKKDAPTLFQINGPAGQLRWESYMADLSDAEFTKQLNEDTPPLKNDQGQIIGVPFAVEGYGIIVNEEIFDKYFALPGATATSLKEINSFDKLKEVSDDMQARKADLGIDGAFAAASLSSGEEWRYQTHLLNTPMDQEFKDAGVTDMDNMQFTYNKEFKNLFDLYLEDSTVAPSLTPSKAVSDSMADFALGKAAMVQNGNWAWSQISDVDGNVVKEDKIKFIPMYMGLPDESSRGISVGTESYLAVNSKASEEDQKASIDFANWLYAGDGMQYVVDDLGFIAPFKGFKDLGTPDDPLGKQVAEAIQDSSLKTYPWTFQYMPSQQFKDDFGADLAQYAAGNLEWDEVVKAFQENWAAEKEANWKK